MLALLQSLLESLRLFLVIKAYRARWDLENDIDEDIDSKEREIERLRSSGASADRAAADRLLQRLSARNALAYSLRSEIYRPAEGKDGGNK